MLRRRDALAELVGDADVSHDDLVSQAAMLSGDGADRMRELRGAVDRLELAVGDEHWPLPKYREMLFPV